MSATDPDLTIFSDASLSGWGAVMNEVSSKGPWTLGDKNRHINELELLAALNGLKCFTSQVSNLSVRLMLDNFMAVHYITKSGGTRSPALSAISADIVDWCEKRQL
jgi:ribonuclease HI